MELDVYFNGTIVGYLTIKENSAREYISRKAQEFLPQRALRIKEIFVPHKFISLIEIK